jgi:YfiH family protein
VLTHAPWLDVPGLRHGFLGRGECAGATAWEPIVAGAGAAAPIVTPRQVHGTGVVDAVAGSAPSEGDAAVAARAGVLVGVVAADCVPVLLVDPRRRLAAAVHAGWRGAAAGVVEAAIARLVAAGAEPASLEAAIGPAIGGCCYVVGDEVRTAFATRTGTTTAAAWAPHGDRWTVDLRTAVRLLLAAAGVSGVATLGPCTACGSGYFSYRREGAGTGRQLSFVGWP